MDWEQGNPGLIPGMSKRLFFSSNCPYTLELREEMARNSENRLCSDAGSCRRRRESLDPILCMQIRICGLAVCSTVICVYNRREFVTQKLTYALVR